MESNKYYKVTFNDIITNSDLVGEVYVKLGIDKFVKIADCIDDLSIQRLTVYKDRGATALYFKKSDVHRYLRETSKNIEQVIKDKKIRKNKKVLLLQNANNILIQNFFHNEIDSILLTTAKSVINTTLSFALNDKAVCDMLLYLDKNENYLYAHSLGVALYSVILARALSWGHDLIIKDICMGGLLHDIGKKKDLNNIRTINTVLANDSSYQQHVEVGYDILFSIIPRERRILDMVLQHHEHADGTGFPRGIKRTKIYYPARIIRIIDDFCNYIYPPDNSKKMSIKQAIDAMIMYRKHTYDSEIFNKFLSIFCLEKRHKEVA